LEVDCWDGVKNAPIVTHGHTFVTSEAFANVSNAVAETAFVFSDLPVSLSLEMHCSLPQQRRLATMLMRDLGSALLVFEELEQVQTPASLSPSDLKLRVLLKGKANLQRRKTDWVRAPGGAGNSLRRSFRFVMGAKRLAQRSLSRMSSSGAGELMPNAEETRRWSSELDFDEKEEAQQSLARRYSSDSSAKRGADDLYISCLGLRTIQVKFFLGDAPLQWPLNITSINEDRLLKEMGLSRAERDQIEDLSSASVIEGQDLTEAQPSTTAIVRLAADPPPDVGVMQRRTESRLLRPFPLGLRFSGKNMSPIPAWLAGAQCVCLNMSNTDLAIQLHFALFNGSRGFVLKPAQMRAAPPATDGTPDGLHSDSHFWPLPRETLHRTSIEVLSLHQLPKLGEQRPRYSGSRSECHEFASELSGVPAPPNDLDPSCPQLTFQIHPIGGFGVVSKVLPIPHDRKVQIALSPGDNGMNSEIGETAHCIAAEPLTTILRISVTDTESMQELAYETAVLGRLRSGYRVFQFRGPLGTRAELCYLFVRISLGEEAHMWPTARELLLTRRTVASTYMKLARAEQDNWRGQRSVVTPVAFAERTTGADSVPSSPR